MWRTFHSLAGLLAAVFLLVIAFSGAILSVSPALERAGATVPTAGEVSVADLAQRVVTNYPGTEQIKRLENGAIVVYYTKDDSPGADLVDPITGQTISAYQPSPFFRWVKDLHRAFLQDDGGRLLAGAMAALMVLMCVSGIFVLARRAGGWRALLRPFRGSGDSRVHAELARLAVIGLLLSALTGSYLSAVRFGLLPEATGSEPAFPALVSGGTPAAIGSLEALKNIDINQFNELVFPYPDDLQDVFSLSTTSGSGFIDQSTGKLLQFEPTPESSFIYDWMMRLHTGEGLWWLALILGVSALSVPVLSISGTRLWWSRRQASIRLVNNADTDTADTIILVGSESNATWGFAKAFQQQLITAGRQVLAVDMNQLAEHYPKATRLFVLTSTYGDGDAPASANLFMEKLTQFQKTDQLSFAVLGFGDHQYSKFCQFAIDVDEALGAHGLERLETIGLIDRQSGEQFTQWGKRIAKVTSLPIELNYSPAPVTRIELQLIDRADFGVEVQAPTSILRFGKTKHSLPAFEAGDLIGIYPPGDTAPRYYSLASSNEDGMLEICVRKQTDGLCSGYLHNLKAGDRIQGFIQLNPDFRPAPGNMPIILIGAGAGIGPLAGFIRKNNARHPMYLYWGGRNPQSDFLYQSELGDYLQDKRLSGLNTAFSRTVDSAYVQDSITKDAANVREMIEKGAQILVCGGRGMALGVKQVMNDVLLPLNLDVDSLKRDGRYLEDVY